MEPPLFEALFLISSSLIIPLPKKPPLYEAPSLISLLIEHQLAVMPLL